MPGSLGGNSVVRIEVGLEDAREFSVGSPSNWYTVPTLLRPPPVVAEPKLKMKAPPLAPAKPSSYIGRVPPVSCSMMSL